MTILDMKQIHFQPANQSVLTIDDFSLIPGEVLGVMGPNGAGKSTFLKILALLEEPTSGTIYYHGKEVSAHSLPIQIRRQFAIVLQQSLLFNMNVFQNVATGLKLRGLKKAVIQPKVMYWLERFHIAHLATRHASKLSGGESQRVNLARALALEPEILFLDEPFSALDFPTKIELIHELKDILIETKTTAVFISHDLQEINYLSNRLVIIMNGQIAEMGPTREVIEHPNEKSYPFLHVLKEFHI